MIDIEKLAKEYGLTEFVYGTEYVSDSLVNFAEAYAAKVLEDKEREIAELKKDLILVDTLYRQSCSNINDLREGIAEIAAEAQDTYTNAALTKLLSKTPAHGIK